MENAIANILHRASSLIKESEEVFIFDFHALDCATRVGLVQQVSCWLIELCYHRGFPFSTRQTGLVSPSIILICHMVVASLSLGHLCFSFSQYF